MTIDLAGLEAQARGCIPDQVAFDYVAGGAGDEITLLENVAAWRRLRLRPRMLRDVSNVSTETTVLGTTIHTPELIAPTAMHGMVHRTLLDQRSNRLTVDSD